MISRTEYSVFWKLMCSHRFWRIYYLIFVNLTLHFWCFINFMSLDPLMTSRVESQVFAEEVEPTGAVPMELSLERYRHAALPSKFPEGAEDQRLRPRISPYLFPNSHIIGHDKSHFQRLLNVWFGNSKQTWRLIYRASTHGYSASAFHRHCDGVAPIYLIVLVCCP